MKCTRCSSPVPEDRTDFLCGLCRPIHERPHLADSSEVRFIIAMVILAGILAVTASCAPVLEPEPELTLETQVTLIGDGLAPDTVVLRARIKQDGAPVGGFMGWSLEWTSSRGLETSSGSTDLGGFSSVHEYIPGTDPYPITLDVWTDFDASVLVWP